jgi:diguanylate cyclase (GGDEF)-like protein
MRPAVELLRTSDIQETCRIAVAELAAVHGLLPSVYLERGGRLRCQAVQGYWQVRDGIAPGTGVIGEVFRTGRESVVDGGAALDTGYLPAAEAVVAEIALPLHCGDHVVGVLNVESQRVIDRAEIELIRETAELLDRRLTELGGLPPESAAQRLVRHVARIATLPESEAVELELLEAAVDVVTLDSAMLLRVDVDGNVRAGHAIGPLAPTLLEASAESLAAVAGFVTDGTSAYTVGTGGGAPAGLLAVRGAGVGALGAVKVGEHRILLIAGMAESPPSTDEMERLELLALHSAVVLRTVASVSALRAEAASDPLTGLGHHGAFHQALEELGPEARVAVLVADIDAFKTFNDRHGHPAGDVLLRSAALALGHALRRDDQLYRIGGDEFAALLHLADEAEALDIARRLHGTFTAGDLGVGVSVGVAVRDPGEGLAAALARADGALYAVKRAGRDGVRLAAGAGDAAVDRQG